ncbi:MAG: pentapeptide repeat-containing protein [Cyanobacteriota bacterium]|nr:pentapeptide repeat-containing protein [Cyanobacteriota bacterium]
MDADELLQRYAAGERNFQRLNLRGINLRGADLRKINFGRTDLTEADLREANLSQANFNFAKLSRANLSKANLSKTQLSDASLIAANLSEANLSESYLNKAKLCGVSVLRNGWMTVNLNGCNLYKADLSGTDISGLRLINVQLIEANLAEVQALATKFEGVNLTGACIEDWHTNSKTKFNNVICEYIYLKYDQQERRPHNPETNFAPGEFAQRFQKLTETLDLLFRDGIDWQAFAYSFRSLRVEDDTGEFLEIQSIQKVEEGDILVRIRTPAGIDKGKKEKDFWQGYEFAQTVIEHERQSNAKLINSQKEQITWCQTTINQLINQVSLSQSLQTTVNNISMRDNYNQPNSNIGINRMRGEIHSEAKIAAILHETQPKIPQLIASLEENIQALSNLEIRNEAIEYLSDLKTEIKAPEPKNSRLKATLLALWNIGKDVTVLANGITALAERFGLPLFS